MSLDKTNRVAQDLGLQPFKAPYTDYRHYRAKVVDVEDELKSGRVKVWIPDLMLNVPEDEGIWAWPANNIFSCDPKSSDPLIQDCGSCLVPPKNTFVEVFFEDGDYSKPRYRAGLVVQDGIPVENTYGDKWWNKWTLLKTPQGRMIFISDDESNDSGLVIRGKIFSKNGRRYYGDPRFPNEGRFIEIWEQPNEEYIIVRDKKYQYILFDEANERVRIQHASGSYIEMQKNGDIIIWAARYVFIRHSGGNLERHL